MTLDIQFVFVSDFFSSCNCCLSEQVSEHLSQEKPPAAEDTRGSPARYGRHTAGHGRHSWSREHGCHGFKSCVNHLVASQLEFVDGKPDVFGWHDFARRTELAAIARNCVAPVHINREWYSAYGFITAWHQYDSHIAAVHQYDVGWEWLSLGNECSSKSVVTRGRGGHEPCNVPSNRVIPGCEGGGLDPSPSTLSHISWNL